MNSERFEGEGMTEFTMRRLRNEIIEQCAKVADAARESAKKHYGAEASIGASCGLEYALNNHEGIMLPWHRVKELYVDLARIHGVVGTPTGERT